jgi:hypothetical protein
MNFDKFLAGLERFFLDIVGSSFTDLPGGIEYLRKLSVLGLV